MNLPWRKRKTKAERTLKVSDIQNVVFEALHSVEAHILQSTVYCLSDDPAEACYDPTVQRPTFIVGAIMTRKEFEKFRDYCNKHGVWINRPTFWPFDNHDKYEYSISAVEKD